MKLKINLNDLNTPNKNTTMYSEDVIKNLLDKNEDEPIRLCLSSVATENLPIIGTAKLININYPEIIIDVDVADGVMKNLIRKNIGSFSLDSILNSNNSLDYTINPDQSYSFELVKS